MANFDWSVAAAARYHLVCPLCKEGHGHVEIEECGRTLRVTCKTCGKLGDTTWEWDFAVPSGISQDHHGQSLGRILTVWFKDNPPDAITTLGAIGRRAEEEEDA